MKINKVFQKKKNFNITKSSICLIIIVSIITNYHVECNNSSSLKSNIRKLHENNSILSKESNKEWPFKEIHRDKYSVKKIEKVTQG